MNVTNNSGKNREEQQ